MQKVFNDIIASLSGRRDFLLADIELDSWLYPISLDFTLQKEAFYYPDKDAEGVPVRVYQSVGRQYNPTRIAGYGLAHWNLYRQTGQKDHCQTFIKIAEWFSRSKDSVWYYHFDWGELTAPWVSCMAQGQGISVLVRMHVLTGDDRYLEQAQRALAPFERPIDQGGVQSTLGDGDIFWEEYPSARPQHALNGYLFAVIGMIELQQVLALPLLARLLNTARNTLEHHLQRWDLGYWSAYDLANEQGTGPRNVCTTAYHSLHSSQTAFIGRRFGSAVINDMAAHWLTHLGSFSSRLRALLGKMRYRIYDPPQR